MRKGLTLLPTLSGELDEGRADDGDARMCYILLLFCRAFHLPDFDVDNPPIPKTLPEVPTKPGETIEEAELEEVADADSTITLTNL